MMKEKYIGQLSSRAYVKIKRNSYGAWPNEWGGLLVIKDGVVEDIVVLAHTANSVTFEIDDDELANFMIHLMETDPDKMKYIKGWVHCHPMVGWSGTDAATIARLLPHFGDYCVSIVDQSAKRLRFRIDRFTGDKVETMDDIDFEIVASDDELQSLLPMRQTLGVQE